MQAEAGQTSASAGASRRRKVNKIQATTEGAPADDNSNRAAPPIGDGLRRLLDSVFADSPKARADVEFVLASEGFTETETWAGGSHVPPIEGHRCLGPGRTVF